LEECTWSGRFVWHFRFIAVTKFVFPDEKNSNREAEFSVLQMEAAG
jgi:hypothetical protein